MSRLQFNHVHKRYGDAPDTIRDLHLELPAGAFSVFIGPSGCGKSTVLRMIAGLEEISEGEISIDGVRMNDRSPAERGVAMVFQSYALYPHMTVAENMAFGLKVMKLPADQIDARVREAARMLQLEPLLERLPKALSGGQRQRVAIGRAIVKEPKVFLFDEPLSNLDAGLRGQTRVELAKLHRQLGQVAAVYVTHDQVEAMTLADQIVLLRAGDDARRHGSVAQVGSPMMLYHRPNSRFVAEFIGSPPMNVLQVQLSSAEDRLARLKLAGQLIDAYVDARKLAPDALAWLGIRPEHVRLGSVAGAAQFQAGVDHVERLGDSSLIYAKVSGVDSTWVVRTDEETPSPGSVITLSLLPSDLHLFDSDGWACPRTVEFSELM